LTQDDNIENNLKSLIAIDGPVAVGKSSVGSLLARKLNYFFFDTGLMYRAFTWKALKFCIPPTNEKELSQLARITKFDFVPHQEGYLSPLIDGEDVSVELLCPEIEEQVSLISKVAGVRQVMVSEQRMVAQQGKVIMAGRDIGTVVLPRAELKIFLVASIEERAKRRYKELLQRGEKVDYDATLADLKRRDDIDIHRAISPLMPAADAIIIDTEKLSLEQVVDKIYRLVVKLD
jgi:cytidylate kinase